MQIVLFDGYCNLCSSTVKFILRKSSSVRFCFIPLQSETGKCLMKRLGIVTNGNDSVVYVKDNYYFIRSDAILHILKDIGKGWQIFYYCLIIVPSFVRDPIYNFVARLRYRLWGKRETCPLPDKKK